MLQVQNVKVYDLEESVIACRNAMRTELPEYTEVEFEQSLERAKKLVRSSAESKDVKCHDNFLTGIRVSFDLIYPNYISPELQRYHWIDIVTSSSKMHRIMKLDFRKSCNKYVTQETIEQMEHLVHCYNGIPDDRPDLKDKSFMLVISNCPLGLELFMRVSTNYKQLQTIYHQRKNHKLKEDYGALCDFIRSLPYAKEFITGE